MHEIRPKRRILLSAYACKPGEGSEEGIGWNVATHLARRYEVWALVRTCFRPAIEEALARKPVKDLHFCFYDGLFPDRGLRQGWRIQCHYYLWQLGVLRVARRLHAEVRFDLAHHITYARYWTPSLLAFLPVPFILGPVGGGETGPRSLRGSFRLRGRVFELLRDAVRRIGEIDPFVRYAIRRSAVTIASTPESAERLIRLGAGDVRVLNQCALSGEEIRALGALQQPEGTPIRFISMGRLLHWKGFGLGLLAFAEASIPWSEYWIVGDGPERRPLERAAAGLGLGDRVKFHGALPRQEALRSLGGCHILVHPSVHDSGSFSCLEAMAAGRPCICLGTGGPAQIVGSRSGIAVMAASTGETVHEIASAMKRLAFNPALRREMGLAARRRAEACFNWSLKVDYFSSVYDQCLESEERSCIVVMPSHASF